MKKTVVITSIFHPTEAIKKLSSMRDVNLIVVGDTKTPSDWSWPEVDFISIDQQTKLGFGLPSQLPLNHYSRKMVGYLVAIQSGSEIIIDTDDDNLPKPNWEFPAFQGSYQKIAPVDGFVNIYQWFTKAKIWPRGLPLELVLHQFDLRTNSNFEDCNVGVWQGLADNDPDVDAIYRLTNGEPCIFEAAEPVVLPQNTICPFNSQNTAFCKKMFPLLYLPTSVTFRFTDILRGLVAQPIMWSAGFELGFLGANVFQERNPHDLMRDFDSEVPMYRHCANIVDIVAGTISSQSTLEENLLAAYLALRENGIVTNEEILTLKAWLHDLDAKCGISPIFEGIRR